LLEEGTLSRNIDCTIFNPSFHAIQGSGTKRDSHPHACAQHSRPRVVHPCSLPARVKMADSNATHESSLDEAMIASVKQLAMKVLGEAFDCAMMRRAGKPLPRPEMELDEIHDFLKLGNDQDLFSDEGLYVSEPVHQCVTQGVSADFDRFVLSSDSPVFATSFVVVHTLNPSNFLLRQLSNTMHWMLLIK
jgi:hypothetical protein